MYLGTVLQFKVVCRWDQCYMRNWKEHKPRFRFKIKASYIVSTEGDVRRVTVLYWPLKQPNKH